MREPECCCRSARRAGVAITASPTQPGRKTATVMSTLSASSRLFQEGLGEPPPRFWLLECGEHRRFGCLAWPLRTERPKENTQSGDARRTPKAKAEIPPSL